MSLKKFRNYASHPMIERQNSYTQDEILLLHCEQGWRHGLNAAQRLSQHHTLASARRAVIVTPHINTPRDRLDLALSSSLRNDGHTTFADVPNFYTQPETLGNPTWRLLRNEIPAPYERKFDFNHPLQLIGTNERNLAHQVKLDATREHLVLTSSNFHRRNDGGFFRV